MSSSKRSRKKENRLMIVVALIIAISAVVVFGFSFYMKQGIKPLKLGDTTEISVSIPSGSGTMVIGRILEEKQIIKSGDTFKFQSKMKGYDGKFKAGEYSLSPGMGMLEIMDLLVSGKTNTLRFTIPEGYDLAKTKAKLEKEGLVNGELFLQEVQSGDFPYEFLSSAPQGRAHLEGYLFPETYDVYTNASEHDIINRMLQQFDKVFTEEYRARAKELNLSINEVITIASLIERETKIDAERAVVSSVIYNRIQIGMKLQIDATIQYVLGEQKDRLSYSDLEIDSPYNTYKIEGLPPGPICSPGKKAIYAALYPEKTDYIYYVASEKLDGSHNFSHSYEEFLKDKEAYLKAVE